MEQHPSQKMTFSSFAKLRPKNVLTYDHMMLNQCLCEYCQNIQIKVDVVKKACLRIVGTLVNIPSDKYDIMNATLCQKEGKYHKKCIDWKCEICGVID